MRRSKNKPFRQHPSDGLKKDFTQKSRTERSALAAISAATREICNPRNDLSPKLHMRQVSLDKLQSAKRRVRKLDPAHVERLVASLRKFGFCSPVLITSDYCVVDGHVRVEAARQLGMEDVSCVVVDHLNEQEIRMLRIAINKLSERGTWDIAALEIEFKELVVHEPDLWVTGFDLPEIDMLTIDLPIEAPLEEVEAIPARVDQAVSRPGDLWQLGSHRLLQGDARSFESYDVLFEGVEKARLLLTDEPYNISIRTITGDSRHREFKMASGEMSRAEFLEFNIGWMKAAMARLAEGGLLSTAIDWRQIDVVMEAARSLGLAHINTAVWSKTNAGQGSLWRSAHEFYPFFHYGNAPHTNNVELGRHGRWRSNLWTYPGGSSLGSDSRNGLKLHPTVKPRKLVADVLMDVTHRGDVVIDCFCGSGTTIVAAEATGRRCMAIEIDAAYCDVAIRRWEQMTGQSAVLASTGASFSEIANVRVSDETVNSEPRNDEKDA